MIEGQCRSRSFLQELDVRVPKCLRQHAALHPSGVKCGQDRSKLGCVVSIENIVEFVQPAAFPRLSLLKAALISSVDIEDVTVKSSTGAGRDAQTRNAAVASERSKEVVIISSQPSAISSSSSCDRFDPNLALPPKHTIVLS